MRKTIALVAACLAVVSLAGCVGNPPRQGEAARHDLGEMPGVWHTPGFPVAALNVRATSWLDTPALAYRLIYVDSLRRLVYADNRWVAPPAELIERFLRRRIVFGQPDFSGPGCRLNLVLDELDQRFDSPQASQVVLEVRASLLPRAGEVILSKRAFLIEKPAPTQDAAGGVAATREAAQALAGELAQWLGELVRERPQAVSLCKEKP